MRKKRPPFIGHYSEFLCEDNATYPGSDELLSIGSPVGKKLGLEKIGIHIEIIPPGRRTSWPHAEKEEEEFAYVIEGTPEVWIDGHLHALHPGDFVAFPSGTGIAHTFLNNSSSSVLLLVGGERSKAENKIYYPLHPKRNEEMQAKNALWENYPQRDLGPHNGMATLLEKDREGNAIPRIVGLHHVALIAGDYERSKKFYTEILGLIVLREVFRAEKQSMKCDMVLPGQEGTCGLAPEGPMLELFSFPKAPARPSYPEAQGLRHLAFQVQDVQHYKTYLESKGIAVEKVRIDEYTGKQFTFFADPDLLPIEIYQL